MKIKRILKWLRLLSLTCGAIGASLALSIAIASNIAVAQEKPHRQLPELKSPVCRNLASDIEVIINRPELTRSRWGIEIQTQDGKSLYSLDADKFFTPASSLKLLTSAAGLSTLGVDYRWQTPVYTVGQPPNLASLRIEGKGDPTVTFQDFKNIVHQLQALGVKEIGELIVDDSYFAPPAINPTWEWLDVHSYFATAANSAILNQNTVRLTILPQQVGKPVKYYWSDAIAARQWRVINQGVTGATNIPYGIELDGDLGKPILKIRGELAANAKPDVWDLAIVDPGAYFLESLRWQLEKSGIKVNRGSVAQQSAGNPLETKSLTLKSTGIAEILAAINQDSNNLYAETLGKTLAQRLKPASSPKAIAQSLSDLGLEQSEYVLVDASGLSRQNLITPQALVKTMQLMLGSSTAEVYRNSLAVAASRGTLKHRFNQTDLSEKVWGKTGTLTGVGTFSGYLSDRDNNIVFFSILVNNSDLSSREIRQAIDEVVMLLNHPRKC